jgi:hypothetical protein
MQNEHNTKIYGLRLARRAFLKIHFQDGHPVLEIENQLIGTVLAELINSVESSLVKKTASKIRSIATDHILSSDEDEHIQKIALQSVLYMTDDEIIPRMN